MAGTEEHYCLLNRMVSPRPYMLQALGIPAVGPTTMAGPGETAPFALS